MSFLGNRSSKSQSKDHFYPGNHSRVTETLHDEQRWVSELAESDIACIESVCHQQMHHYNYTVRALGPNAKTGPVANRAKAAYLRQAAMRSVRTFSTGARRLIVGQR